MFVIYDNYYEICYLGVDYFDDLVNTIKEMCKTEEEEMTDSECKEYLRDLVEDLNSDPVFKECVQHFSGEGADDFISASIDYWCRN